MKTRTTVCGSLGIAALLLAGTSTAALITPAYNPSPTDCDLDGADQTCWRIDHDGNANQPSLADLADIVGEDEEDFEILYKSNAGGGEEGTLKANYDAVFTADAGGPSGGTITYVGGASIDCPVCYLWVKDGKHNPYLYIFDISWWDGVEELVLEGFWAGSDNGSISNVGIFGGEGGDMQVPEPAPLALLGLAAIGLGLARHRRNA